jgi:hypothetical protein
MMLAFSPGEVRLPCDGVALLEQRLDHSKIECWAESIQRRYAPFDATRSPGGAHLKAGKLPQTGVFVPTASSLRLHAALGEVCVGRLVDHLAGDGVADAIVAAIGGAVVIDLDQCWVRRQYAPHHYPPLHAPHGWHQDGALGFDFGALGAHPPPQDALLSMVTCWFPVGACGNDAPGLEFVMRRQRGLLSVKDLTEAAMRGMFPAEAFWRSAMSAGDVLLFGGDILHRTYVAPTMKHDRTSIELRFFPADEIPVRLSGDRFVPVGSR